MNKKITYSWINKKLIVKNTKNYGHGIYAKNKIFKDEKIAIFGGYIMSREEEEKLPKEVYDNGIQIDDDFIIGVKKKLEIEAASYFNHSCDPNAGLNGQIFLVAMRDIVVGEQITFDYAMVLNKSSKVKSYKIKCLCGSKKCRKIITDEDWKNPVLQKKYKGYFSFYLEQKIKNLKHNGI